MISDISPDWSAEKAAIAKGWCREFLEAPAMQLFLFGRNLYSEAIANKLRVDGIVDDFTDLLTWYGVPIVKLADLPADAMVLACSGGWPLTVRKLLETKDVDHLDYFAFRKFSGVVLPEAVFNEDCVELVARHKSDLNWVEGLLADDTSSEIMRKLMTIRISYDLDALEGFKHAEDAQYFEPFIDYTAGAPVFVDVGGFDGFTTKEFIRHAPNYTAVHVFEPEEGNQNTCKMELDGIANITIHPYGAGAEEVVQRFSASGCASAITEDGELEIQIRRIDNLVYDVPTFIKMDIEGAELDALDGMRRVISDHHPALAICVHHRPSDIWEVPHKVLSMHNKYSVYLRHYTESIYETVMFFVPNEMHIS